MRDNSSLTLVKDSHIWLKHSKMLYSGIYCLFLFIRTISFQKQAPTKVFPIVVTLAFARLSRHFESSCWHASATAPYNRSAIYTSYIYGHPMFATSLAAKNCVASCRESRSSFYFSPCYATSCSVWHPHCNLSHNFFWEGTNHNTT